MISRDIIILPFYGRIASDAEAKFFGTSLDACGYDIFLELLLVACLVGGFDYGNSVLMHNWLSLL